jgi:membrane protein
VAAWQEEDWLISLDRRLVAWFWRPGYPRRGPAGWGHLVLQMLYLALRGSYLDRLAFQANALAFMTLLGLVPALAISFAVAKGFGFAGALEKLLVDNEFLASQAEVFRQIISYVQNTQVGTLGVVGLAVLLITLLWTLSSVEETFNRVWEVPIQRTLLRRFTDYLSVLVICPLLVVASAAIWAGFASNAVVRWLLGLAVLGPLAETGLGLGPFLLLAAAFVFMYLFLPNTRVPFWPALLAGLVAAVLWWGVQSVYIYFQVGVARYNAIYGGFASLPLFFIWVQVSWMVLLFGNELARAGHVCLHGPLPRALLPHLSPAQRQELALRLMFRVGRRFHQGASPASPEELAGELGLALGEVERVLERLVRAGLLTAPDAQRRTMPARSLSAILVAEVVEAVQGSLDPADLGSPQPGEERLFMLLERAAQCGRQALNGVNFADLLQDEAERP